MTRLNLSDDILMTQPKQQPLQPLPSYDTQVVIDPSHKSHNAFGHYPTMHHSVTEMCTHMHISVTK